MHFMNMSNNRRKFLKMTGLTGLGLAAQFLPAYAGSMEELDQIREQAERTPPKQRFNMSGYAAPKLETVRIGFVGIGNRGYGAVERMTRIEGVQIKALCDLRAEKVNEAQQLVQASGHQPALYSGDPEAWKKLCERDDLDLDLYPYALGIAYADSRFFHEPWQACLCGSSCCQDHRGGLAIGGGLGANEEALHDDRELLL
jgi:hypothetical protein